ncbi:UNVERIFIED_CONTAM: hypothetical protein Slati_1568600 [Sesamum latifolium]|uniref:Secreted protein n=1 Tax=Sesamum latifolium TaxID=2727402 RepID=A0AAW2XBE7_9LAMI
MVCCHRFAVSVLVLVISTSSQFRLFGIAEGRKMAQTADNFQDDTHESKFSSSGRQWMKIRRQCGEPRSVRGRRSASGGAVLAPTVKPFKCRQTRKQGAQSRTQPQVLPPPTPEATTTPTTSP